jgi:hypothetical protein
MEILRGGYAAALARPVKLFGCDGNVDAAQVRRFRAKSVLKKAALRGGTARRLSS